MTVIHASSPGELPTLMAVHLHSIDCPRIRSHSSEMIEIRQLPSLLRLSLLADGTVARSTVGIAAGTSAGKKSVAHSAADHCTPGLALAGHGEALNELAFHFLLEIERKRFQRSEQPYALLLIDLNVANDGAARIDEALSARVFDALASALRETDVIGWYRERRIVGALLTHLDHGSVVEVCNRLSERIIRSLHERLPLAVAARVVVRRQFQEISAS
jgi:hypothetical protein